jgi:transcriptional regulator with XRE-family HTH domain
MPAKVSPEVRRRRLAAELRRLRDRAGLTGDEVASRLGWSPSKVSRYELARTGLRPADVKKMLVAYGVDGQRQRELLALAQEATEKGWWEEYSDVMSEDYVSLIGLEYEAGIECSWHLEVVPGLLQAEAYARQVNTRGYSLSLVPPSLIERSVRARMKRQEVLTRDSPLELSVVLDEAVLRRNIGGPSVMKRQLNHLIEAAQLPNISLRVLRLADDCPIVMNSFDLLGFGRSDQETTMPDVVWTEHLRSTLYFEGEADTYQYRIVFERLFESAVGESDSLELIARTTAELWS